MENGRDGQKNFNFYTKDNPIDLVVVANHSNDDERTDARIRVVNILDLVIVANAF